MMTRQKLALNLNASLEKPTFWALEGSKFRRNVLPSHMSEEFRESLPDTFPEGGSFLLRQVEILRPGTYNGWLLDALVMREMADLFNPLDPPPLQEDHSYSARDTHGRVIDLMLDESIDDGPRVLGLVLFLGQYSVERVLDSRWTKFSAGLWLNPAWLEHLAVTPFPACPTAKVLSKEKQIEEISMEKLEQTEAEESSAPVAETEVPKEKQELVASNTELDAVRAELAALRAEHEEAKRLNLETKVRSDLMNLVRSGHSSPDLHEREVGFALSLSDEQRAAYVALRTSMEKLWEPGRLSKPPTDRPAQLGKDKPDDIDRLRKASGIKI